MFTQLQTTIPMKTSKGCGLAFAVIDYGIEHDLLWVVALDDSGEIWCMPNREVRISANWSIGRQQGLRPGEWSE